MYEKKMEKRRLVVKPTEEERKRGENLISSGGFFALLGLIVLIASFALIFLTPPTHWISLLGILLGLGLMTVGGNMITQGKRILEIRLSSTLEEMDPFDFEIFVADLFKKMGYRTKDLRSSGDYGADVIAETDYETVAVQAKHYSLGKKVGSRTVRDVYSASKIYNAQKAVVVTTSFFTKPAVETANKLGVELIDRNKLAKLMDEYYPEN